MPHTRDALRLMQPNPWFASLPVALQRAMVEHAELQRLGHGEMLFRQGEALTSAGGAFFGLLSGHIKISTLRDDGREAILAVLEVGNWFGEISLFDQRPRTHDATAMGRAEVLVLPRPAFDRLMRREPFARAMCQLLAGRVRSLYGMVEDATLRSTRARVARRLMLLAHGDATHADTARCVVMVSQDALAMMVGVTRQTLSKELKALVQLGAVALHYGHIEIASLHLLAQQGGTREV
jgi:CRP-like cAMP-binding protein